MTAIALRAAIAFALLGCLAATACAGAPADTAPVRYCDALPAHPTPVCTGVPPGTTLHEVGGDYEVTDEGAVLDSVHVSGNLTVAANNVTIRNSLIDGSVYNNETGGAYSFTITATTIGPESGCVGQPGVSETNYTAVRVLVRGHDDGFRMSGPGNVTVRDSFAKLCWLPPELASPDGSHSDGVQAYCPDQPCLGLSFVHNTVDARGIPATYMINLNDPMIGGEVAIEENLLAGGGYTMVPQWRSGPKWQVRANSVVDRSWTYAPVSAEGSCAHQKWVGNQIVEIDESYTITSVNRPLGCVS